MQQAVRVSDNTAFFLLGEVVEYNDTEKLFSIPADKRTEDYITGRFELRSKYSWSYLISSLYVWVNYVKLQSEKATTKH